MSTNMSTRGVWSRTATRLARMVAACGAVALLSASACGGNGTSPAQTEDPVPDLDRGTALAWQARPTIVQTLRLVNPGLRVGDTLKLESVLKNVGSSPVSIEHVVCELDLDGDLKTHAPLILCFAYSVRSTLAPGESVTGRLERVIDSEAGKYTIRVRHLLDPDVWVPAELTVHPR